MRDEDIVIGQCYEVDFRSVGFPIDAGSGTQRFRARFARWDDIGLATARALEHTTITRLGHNIDVIKFEILPAPKANSCGSGGEWCLASSSYFNQLPNQPAHTATSPAVSVCQCNIWMNGCTCGVMASERAQKKQKAKKAPAW